VQGTGTDVELRTEQLVVELLVAPSPASRSPAVNTMAATPASISDWNAE